MPKNTVSVCRPGKWGNPFIVGRDGSAEECVAKFRTAIKQYVGQYDSPLNFHPDEIEQLRGKNLACFCDPGTPCHGDVLLEIANQKQNT